MVDARDIRSKITSITNTRKLTRALDLVSAAKIRKARELMRTSRPYALHARRVVTHIAQATPDYRHPALRDRPTRRVCYLVISTDRGLCGGLNHSLFRKVLDEIHGWQQQRVAVELVAIGQQALLFFRHSVEIVGAVARLGDRPRLQQLAGVLKIVEDEFMQGRIDRVYLGYNRFASNVRQCPTVDALLPLPVVAKEGLNAAAGDPLHPPPDEVKIVRAANWDYLYEPDAETAIRHVLKRYYEGTVYHAVLENLASEHAARMVAMKAATDNADKAIRTLTLIYNKARQASITRELCDIVNGANAIAG